MKKRVIFLITVATALSLLSSRPGTALHQAKSSVLGNFLTFVTSKDDIRSQLNDKIIELNTYEKVLADIDAEHKRMIANAPICPTTGRKTSVTMTTDPRPEIHQKIMELNEEIARLERRLD